MCNEISMYFCELLTKIAMLFKKINKLEDLKCNPTSDKEMKLKVYCDRMSQPSRAILIFCKINGINFEEVTINILKNEQHTPEYKAINPMSQVPAIVDGGFTLFESHAILIYLSGAYPRVASHWYPNNLQEKAKVQSVLDWHHSNLRRGSVGVIINTVLGPLNGLPSSPQAAEEAEKTLAKSLSILEDFWLKDGPFLVGRSQPSIADLSLVCEIMELELLSEKDRYRILSPYKKVLKWVENTKNATAPHFDEVHGVLFKAKKGIQEQLATNSG
ncbi:S-crystallin [Artemisia annua]|uniref:glutathione transferase n=1 Tax=Artemisia annua TaxID=35608 RepID=A0A2U1MHY5_ARTAN|nr:S-crystallin [Artemisia annua]